MSLPLQIYDFISIVFPGILALTIARIEQPNLPIWSVPNEYAQLAIWFVIAYAIGHLCQGLASNLAKKCKMYNSTDEPPLEQRHMLRGRHYLLDASETFSNEFEAAFRECYSIDPNALKKEEAFGLIFSSVQDKLGQRPIFVARANMLRSLAFISALYLVYAIGKTIYILCNPAWELYTLQTIVLIFLLSSAVYIFVKGSNKFKQFTDWIPYYAFIAWWKYESRKQQRD
jgi:hypothetical protein